MSRPRRQGQRLNDAFAGLRSAVAPERAAAADAVTDSISASGHHPLRSEEYAEVAALLADLAVAERDDVALEAELNALGGLASWGVWLQVRHWTAC
ncbi:hypothetical protein [Nocardioides speluncae]|uniref:hypothetical protein n=1 Tax=Nocardioides speluncae TaxID=2670337 RepID=UPI000D69C1F4|nr:hypothetical protein [Nocardioides speluncae]